MLLCETPRFLSAAEHAALDEWLWREVEMGRLADDLVRLWETDSHAVVLGRGSQVQQEIDPQQVQADQVPLVRRISGGAAVVCGPGCLMYSLVLRKEQFPELSQIDTTHRFVLDRLAAAITARGVPVEPAGTSDLVLVHFHPPRKCSGNSMRFGRRAVLYHGTLLYAMDLSVIPRWLPHPPREPAYRDGRLHQSFVANLPLSGDSLRQAVLTAFPVDGTCLPPPREHLVPTQVAPTE